MEWQTLQHESQLDEIINVSNDHPVVIFKHSTRCSISSAAKGRLERHWENQNAKKLEAYYLDLLNYRNISNKIAEVFNVQHESPQALVIKEGKCVYTSSHYDISYEDLLSHS